MAVRDKRTEALRVSLYRRMTPQERIRAARETKGVIPRAPQRGSM